MIQKNNIYISVRFLFLIGLIGFMFSCKGTKFTAEPIPEWMQSPPHSSLYYVGIGSAPKQGYNPDEYIQRAKSNALKDLSSSISVTISSTSMLSVFESDKDISESFLNEIKASTEQYLEGYEQAGVYEDKYNYWVYYRLSRSSYASLKANKKNEALKQSWNKLEQAKMKLKSKSYFEAWSFLADAMLEIKPYMNENTDYMAGDTLVDLGTKIYSDMLNFVNSITVWYPQNTLKLKRGDILNLEQLTFFVQDNEGVRVSNIPVKIEYTGQGLIKNRDRSDNNGAVFCSIGKVNTINSSEIISVSLDMLTLSYVSKDPLIRKIIKQIPVAETQITLHISKPLLNVVSKEKILGDTLEIAKLKNALVRSFSSEFDLYAYGQPVDYYLNIESDITKSYDDGKYYYADCAIIVNLINNEGQSIYSKSYGVEGEGYSYEEAIKDAYNNAEVFAERKIFRDINNKIFN
jgi:hypothetical protein